MHGARYEALEPIRQGARSHFGSFAAGMAQGLLLRLGHGSPFDSDEFQAEIAFLSIESSPAFVRGPEGNGCIERLFLTLTEQLLWVRSFMDAEDVRRAVTAWLALYIENGSIERHGYRPQDEVRRELLDTKLPA